MRTLFFLLGCAGLVLSLSLALPVVVSAVAGENDVALRLSVHFLLGVFVFGTLVLSLRDRLTRLPQVGRLLLLVIVWTFLPLIAAIPITDLSQLSYLDSLFESVSGLTTTGSTVLRTVEAWPQGLLFFRAQLQWIGGYLTIFSIILIVAPLGLGGLSSPSGDIFDGDDVAAIQRRIARTAFQIAVVYGSLTVACALGLFFAGTRPFHALTLAMTAISTGGFLTFDDSVDTVLSQPGIFIFSVFLLLGATSIFWHRMLVRRQLDRIGRHRESYSVIGLALVMALAYAALIISVSPEETNLVRAALVEGFFTAASLVATSGVETRPGVIALMPLVLVLFVIFAGGSAYSSSGGLKHYRIGGMFVRSWSEIDRLLYPSAVRSSRFGSQEYDLALMKAIWSFFIVMIVTIGLGTIFVATHGMPFDAALTATISAFSTAGPVYNSGWAPPGSVAWPAYAEFAAPAKMALVATMLLGRLEVLALLGLVSLRYWSNR